MPWSRILAAGLRSHTCEGGGRAAGGRRPCAGQRSRAEPMPDIDDGKRASEATPSVPRADARRASRARKVAVRVTAQGRANPLRCAGRRRRGQRRWTTAQSTLSESEMHDETNGAVISPFLRGAGRASVSNRFRSSLRGTNKECAWQQVNAQCREWRIASIAHSERDLETDRASERRRRRQLVPFILPHWAHFGRATWSRCDTRGRRALVVRQCSLPATR